MNQSDRARQLDDALASVLPESRAWTRHHPTAASASSLDPLGYWLEIDSPVRPGDQRLVVLLRPDGDIQVEYHVRGRREEPFEALFPIPDGREAEAIKEVAEFVRDLVAERLTLAYARGFLRGGRRFIAPDELARDRPQFLWATSWRGTYDWQS